MTEIHNPHDRFFKEVFSHTEAAAEFFAAFLPKEIVVLLDLSKIEQVKDSFIDPSLQEHLSDLIYRVPLKSGSEAYIYALVEHKSSPDKWVAVQILRYEVATWDAEIKARAKRLTPIIPIVFYHGAKKWNVPREFSSLVNFAGNEALREYVPEFRYHLTDLSQYEDEAIREAIANVILLVMMLLMKNIFKKDLKKKLAEIIRLMKAEGNVENLKTVIKYLTETTARLSAKDLQEAVRPLFESKEGEIMPTIAETWKREGIQQGTAALTLRMLQKRFGKIDESTQKQINVLTFEQLGQLGEALLDFKSPKDLASWLKANVGEMP